MHCWVCGLKGNIKKYALVGGKFRDYFKVFQSHIGTVVESVKTENITTPEDFQRIMFCTDKRILAYLHNRGLSIEEAEDFGVLYKGSELMFTLKDNSQTVYWTIKNLLTDRYRLPELQKQEMVWHIKKGSDTIVVVEGIFDGVKVWKAGYDVLVLLGKELYAKADKYLRTLKKQVVIGLDADAKEQAYKMALRLEDDVRVSVFKFTKKEEKADMDLGEMEVEEVKERIKALSPFGIKEKVQQKIKR